MEISKKLMDKAGILPKLRLGVKVEGSGVESTGPHKVVVAGERLERGIDRDTGKEIEVMRYEFDCDDGERREYEVPVKDKGGKLHYLVQRFAEVNVGDMVTLEMKRQGARNYIQVTTKGDTGEFDLDEQVQ